MDRYSERRGSPDTNTHQHSADPWRQKYHLCPPVGLLNDPNGLVYWQGAFHVFYQWYPYECKHGRKSWAHVRSTDLVNWEWLPAALSPEEWYETHGCYSGSAVVCDDQLYLMYSGNVKTPSGERESYQCLARSSDGISFEKLGPVIGTPKHDYTAHFRDPKVWRENAEWLMVIGAQTMDGDGTVLLYRSSDLTNWSAPRPLLKAGAHGYMCECPDLLALSGQEVLLVSEQRMLNGDGKKIPVNTSGYVVGAFLEASAEPVYGAFRRLDHGADFYAPQTMDAPDGRRLMFGWMGSPELTTAPSVANGGWMHCLTLPRQLHWDGTRLRQLPALELESLRQTPLCFSDIVLKDVQEFPGVHGQTYELEMEFGARKQAAWSMDLRCGEEAFTRLAYLPEKGALVLDKRCSGKGAGGVSVLPLVDGRIEELRVFVDRSSIEVFANHGEGVISERIYPSEEATGILFRCTEGHVNIAKLNFWPI